MSKFRAYKIDILNTQSGYAACLDYIRLLENKASMSTKRDHLPVIKKSILQRLKVQVCDTNNKFAARYFEIPLEDKSGNLLNLFEELPKENYFNRVDADYFYHIRIHFDQNLGEHVKYLNLQYLALLLEIFCDLGIIDKISVFAVPESGYDYPYYYRNASSVIFDSKTYSKVSQFIHLLAARYKAVIYGAYYTNKEPYPHVTIQTADFRNKQYFYQYFPLLIIDADMYQELFDKKLVDKDYKDIIYFLKARAEGKNKSEDQRRYIYYRLLKNIPDLIKTVLSTRINDLLEESNISKDYFFNTIKTIIQDKKNSSLMHFSLFSFLLILKDINSSDEVGKRIIKIWNTAEELCNGLRQIAQNTLQYTRAQECYFSLYMQNSSNLFLLISDINEDSDIISTFYNNLEAELRLNNNRASKYEGHQQLVNSRNIKLRNLFSEFDNSDNYEAWEKFRRQDYTGHVGLSMFALVAEKCNASVSVYSCCSSLASGDTNVYKKGRKELNNKAAHIIPGASFFIEIPVEKIYYETVSGFGKISNINAAHENYGSLARFLDYEPYKEFVVSNQSELTHIRYNIGGLYLDKDEKRNLIEMWRKIWLKRIYDDLQMIKRGIVKRVFIHDMSKIENQSGFNSIDHFEVCIKGLLQCLSELDFEELYLIAITNVNKDFLITYKNLATVFSCRDFPQNIQLCICEKDNKSMIIMLGRNYLQCIYNAQILSYGNSFLSFSRNEFILGSGLYELITRKSWDYSLNENDERASEACPFDALIKEDPSSSSSETLFEKHIKEIIEGPIDKEPGGCKLENTHTRIGSNIHIQSFYELSFLFYRTIVANRIAFIILKQLLKEDRQGFMSDIILFYGYASFSKAILTSLREIMSSYRKIILKEKNDNHEIVTETESKAPDHIGFVSYQHNLLSKSTKIQKYFGIMPGFPGTVNDDNNLDLDELEHGCRVKIIQLVPISTTLSTFQKMWKSFIDSVKDSSRNKIKLYQNYTVFWLREKSDDSTQAKSLSKNYWEDILPEDRTVETKFDLLKQYNCNKIRYFMFSTAYWHDPVNCKLCFPNDPVAEIPLIETDSTSTVPAQQIRYQSNRKTESLQEDDYLSYTKTNNGRILMLRDHIYLGHISRRQNHYQYYIDTQAYFYDTQVKNSVKCWLKDLRKKDSEEMDSISTPVMRVIFSPEHNTNVGFAQYVNNYYFKGMAEIVSFNIDKQFRSNFYCEHKSLADVINRLNKSYIDNKSVYFYYVDDTIITGETYQKASSFLQSLLDEADFFYREPNLFSKIFLLEERISDVSKQAYVKNAKDNFYSFVHLDVSNIRTHGDSCPCCKIRNDLIRLKKRSSTNRLVHEWDAALEKYRLVEYDDTARMASHRPVKAFNRLLMSHTLQNILIKQREEYDLKTTYNLIIEVGLWCLGSKEQQERIIRNNDSLLPYEELLKELRGMNGIKALLKNISRPFLSFDFYIKLPAITILIFLTDFFITGQNYSPEIETSINRQDWYDFLNKGNAAERAEELGKSLLKHFKDDYTQDGFDESKQEYVTRKKIEFLSDYLMEGLADLRSNFLYRTTTLIKIFKFSKECEGLLADKAVIRKFWEKYSNFVHRYTEVHGDEARKLRLEFQHLTENEIGQGINIRSSIASINPCQFRLGTLLNTNESRDTAWAETKKSYIWFRNEVFLQNIGMQYDFMERIWLQIKSRIIENERNKRTKGSEIKQLNAFSFWETLEVDYNNRGWGKLINAYNKSLNNLPDYNEFLAEFRGNNGYLYDYWKLMRQLDAKSIGREGWESTYDAEVGLFLMLNTNRQKSVPQWYNKFLEILSNLICEKYGIASDKVDLALITLNRTEEIDSEKKAKHTDMDFAAGNFKSAANKNPKKLAALRYETKSRVLKALGENAECTSNLLDHGYYISKDNPYIIVSFRNESGRTEFNKDSDPIAYVFLYVSMIDIESTNKGMYQRLILRDILTYRNRILGFLRKNFMGDIYSSYAHTAGEKNILTHEKASSHTATADDETTVNIFLQPKLFDKSSVLSFKVLTEDEAIKWLLLRNYTNGQIAKLFTRKFSSENDDADAKYPLYPSKDDCQPERETLFKHGIKHFKDLGIAVNGKESRDGRFCHLNKALDIKCEDQKLMDWEFVEIEGRHYNLEYFKCILTDMMLSAIKFQSPGKMYLNRIDYALRQVRPNHFSNTLNRKKPEIIIGRENTRDSAIDYLVLSNPIHPNKDVNEKWKESNEISRQRLEDPLDYADGHMSMLTAKRYVEDIYKTKTVPCIFQYEEDQKNHSIVFVIKLPVLKGDSIKR